MQQFPEGRAIVYCDGALGESLGKTAHGLIRRTARYDVTAVIDRTHAGRDAAEVLDGPHARRKGIPVCASLSEALERSAAAGRPATHFVIGLAPDGGRLPAAARPVVLAAIEAGLNVDSGMHDFLSEDPEIAAAAARKGVRLRDVRKPPERKHLHGFTGRINDVGALRLAVLGTDSTIGKRTTAWMLVEALRHAGHATEMIGTGQTAWMQGAEHGIILDSLVNDFVAGELEHAVVGCWDAKKPQLMVIEGQGSLMNPAYPGGLEILAATRPHGIVLQHAPRRLDYDGFPGFQVHQLTTQIQALELVSGRPVIAITINHEGMRPDEVAGVCEGIAATTGLPTLDPLIAGVDTLLAALTPWLRQHGLG